MRFLVGRRHAVALPLAFLAVFLCHFGGVYEVECLSRQTASNAATRRRKFLSQAESKPASPKVASADRPPQTLNRPRVYHISPPTQLINTDISHHAVYSQSHCLATRLRDKPEMECAMYQQPLCLARSYQKSCAANTVKVITPVLL